MTQYLLSNEWMKWICTFTLHINQSFGSVNFGNNLILQRLCQSECKFALRRIVGATTFLRTHLRRVSPKRVKKRAAASALKWQFRTFIAIVGPPT
jgi:hypothetical protein